MGFCLRNGQSSSKIELMADNHTGKKKLVKMFTREHSLFYAAIWCRANHITNKEFTDQDIENIAYVFEPNSRSLSSYYDLDNVNSLLSSIEKQQNEDPNYFKKVEEVFEKRWSVVEPYLVGQKKIQDVNDLKGYYDLALSLYAPMAVVYVAPENENIPQEYRDLSLRLREKTQAIVNNVGHLVMQFFDAKYPDLVELAYYMLPEEMFILSERQLTEQEKEDILQRKENGCFLYNCKLFSLSEMDFVLSKNNLMIETSQNIQKSEFKGTVAQSGIAQGKVRIIRERDKVREFQQGEILVSPMTMPDFLPAMKQAAAIITDEGGVTCHAAIISRELKTPCIIGTKTATQTLKNGDLVEVDANKGIVKILKKSNE